MAQGQRFLHDRLRIAAAFPPACERNHTEGTHVVATAHDADEGVNAVAVQARGRNIGIGFFEAQQHIDAAAAVFDFVDQDGQFAVCVGTGHDIDEFLFFEQFFFETFGHAAEHTDDQIAFALLVAAQVLEPFADALFGIVADGAGVQENDIGFVFLCGRSFS
jgi:hypothetical protein